MWISRSHVLQIDLDNSLFQERRSKSKQKAKLKEAQIEGQRKRLMTVQKHGKELQIRQHNGKHEIRLNQMQEHEYN